MQSVEFAKELRCHALEMVHRAWSSHIGSVLSIADILAVLYNRILKVDPIGMTGRIETVLFLAKGMPVLGSMLRWHLRASLKRARVEHYSNGSIFSGHVSHKGVPGVDFSTGSPGHGLSVATSLGPWCKAQKSGLQRFLPAL